MIYYSRSISNNIEHESPILIEVGISEKGLPTFDIFGLVSKSIGESKKRILSAFESSGINFPLKNINVNLSPAEIAKEGTHYDLAIAVAILKYTNNIEILDTDLFLGELSLDGSLKRVNNIAFLCLKAKEMGFKRFFIPNESKSELFFIDGVEFYVLNNLMDTLNIHKLTKFVSETDSLKPKFGEGNLKSISLENNYSTKVMSYAVAGRHNIHLEGFPGVGKSHLAKSSLILQPDLSYDEMYQVSKIFSYMGITRDRFSLYRPPFRAPHSSTSYSGVFGTYGDKIYPGEVALANKGILFLDELPEYNRLVLEGLRAPLEDKFVSISRAKSRFTLPCDFMMISTSNPCKCGYFNHPKLTCKCSPFEITKYRGRISGPILDRIDIFFKLNSSFFINKAEGSKVYSISDLKNLLENISQVRDLIKNYKKGISDSNSNNISWNNFIIQNKVSNKLSNLINLAQEKYSISTRKIFKIINLSLTISFFKKLEMIDEESFLEALSLANFSE